MTTLPLGVNAYRRDYAKEPEVVLLNRFLEKAPTNLRERVALLTRPGTKHLDDYPSSDPDGHVRGNYAKTGLFLSDLFTVSGDKLWRTHDNGDGTVTLTAITGTIGGEAYDAPRYAWTKGEGYEHLFLADGTTLYYYPGGTHATGTLTYDGSGSFNTDVVIINGTYYTWSATLNDPLDDGTAGNPFKIKNTGDLLSNLADTLNYNGTPGVDFSTTLGGPSPVVRGEMTTPTTVLTITALSEEADGDAITTTLGGGSSGNLAWGDTTLNGGGSHVLHQIATPEGVGITALTSLNGYVLASVAGSQKFFWIEPGDTTIDPLNFASKEGGPDPIIDMATVGDVAIIAGAGTTEYWSATGDAEAPVAPIQGRAISRGIVAGTLVVVSDGAYCVVASDWKVYMVGDAPQSISDNGIEERIRRQLRREAGLAP